MNLKGCLTACQTVHFLCAVTDANMAGKSSFYPSEMWGSEQETGEISSSVITLKKKKMNKKTRKAVSCGAESSRLSTFVAPFFFNLCSHGLARVSCTEKDRSSVDWKSMQLLAEAAAWHLMH